MIDEQTPQSQLSDDEIYNNLHIARHYLIDGYAYGNQQMLDAGSILLDTTLAQIGDFFALLPETQEELVLQKLNWRRELSAEERAAGIIFGLIPE